MCIWLNGYVEFKNAFYFNNVKFQNLVTISGNTKINHLAIENTFFKEYLVIEDNVIVGNKPNNQCFTISHKTKFEKGLNILGGTFNGQVNIYDGEFKEPILFNLGVVFKGQLHFINGHYHQGVKIEGGEFNLISFTDGKFEKEIIITGGTFKKTFTIEGGEYISGIVFNGGIFEKSLTFYNGEFSKSISFNGGIFINEIYFENGTYNNIDISNSSAHSFINHLEFSLTNKIQNQITIKKDSRINTLKLTQGISADGAVYVQSITLYALIIENFTNKGIFEFNSLEAKNRPYSLVEENTEDSKIIFTESQLDEVVFTSVDFESFDKLTIDATKLHLITTIESHFPIITNPYKKSSKQKIQSGLEETQQKKKLRKRKQKKLYAEKVAEVYSQLYLAMQKQGYKTKEMDYYASFLYWEHKAAKQRSNTFGKAFSLFLHKYSTSFGRWWFLGFLWFVTLSFLFYFLYINQLECEFKYEKCFETQKKFDFGWKYYLRGGHK